MGAKTDPVEAFGRLDLDRNGKLDIDEMEELYTQYIISDNPTDPGNYLSTGSID